MVTNFPNQVVGDVSEGRGGGWEGCFVPSQQEVQTSTLQYKALIWLYGCFLPHLIRGSERAGLCTVAIRASQELDRAVKDCITSAVLGSSRACLGIFGATPWAELDIGSLWESHALDH